MLLQNRISRSRMLLPTIVIYAIAVWLVCGLVSDGLWLQFSCFAISSFLMVELNNGNALIRIYSRMVSCSFIVMVCMSTFLMQSASAMLLSICVVMSFILTFITYQDKSSMGHTFYSFLSIGLATLIDVNIFFFAPVMWIGMFFYLQSLTPRTFVASLLGLLCPYWFVSIYFIYTNDLTLAADHFSQLVEFGKVADFPVVPIGALVAICFVTILSLTGIIHYLRKRINDKTRTRMFYNTFILINIVTIVFFILQPQHYVTLLTIMIVTTSPLIAHFIALTHTRITNIAFKVIVIVALTFTIINILKLI